MCGHPFSASTCARVIKLRSLPRGIPTVERSRGRPHHSVINAGSSVCLPPAPVPPPPPYPPHGSLPMTDEQRVRALHLIASQQGKTCAKRDRAANVLRPVVVPPFLLILLLLLLLSGCSTAENALRKRCPLYSSCMSALSSLLSNVVG